MTSQKQTTFKTKRLKNTVDVLKMIRDKLKFFKTVTLFETGNNDLITQQFRKEFNLQDKAVSNFYIDYPVNEYLRIGLYVEFYNLETLVQLMPFVENVLLMLSEMEETL